MIINAGYTLERLAEEKFNFSLSAHHGESVSFHWELRNDRDFPIDSGVADTFLGAASTLWSAALRHFPESNIAKSLRAA